MNTIYPVILFDGTCGFCHRAVRFILRWERNPIFHFAGFESEAGRALCHEEGVDRDAIRSLVLIRGRGDVLIRSDASLAIAAELKLPWNLLAWLRIIPRGLRDGVYAIISRNRTRLAALPQCSLPVDGKGKEAGRFLESIPPVAVADTNRSDALSS